jgi:hypothetical protein
MNLNGFISLSTGSVILLSVIESKRIVWKTSVTMRQLFCYTVSWLKNELFRREKDAWKNYFSDLQIFSVSVSDIIPVLSFSLKKKFPPLYTPTRKKNPGT